MNNTKEEKKMKVGFVCLLVLLAIVPVSASYFQVPLGEQVNWTNYFNGLPTGNVVFDGVPFLIRESDPAFISTGLEIPGWKGDLQISASVPNSKVVHMLISGGNMYLPVMGNEVGMLRFINETGTALEVPLVAGSNIREWSPYSPNEVINTLTDPAAREVWSGTWSGWMTVPARIDLYSITLPEGFGTLQTIEVKDFYETTAFNIYGISVEVVPEPSSLVTLGVFLTPLLAFRRRR